MMSFEDRINEFVINNDVNVFRSVDDKGYIRIPKELEKKFDEIIDGKFNFDKTEENGLVEYSYLHIYDFWTGIYKNEKILFKAFKTNSKVINEDGYDIDFAEIDDD